jgi:hypothetical protein
MTINNNGMRNMIQVSTTTKQINYTRNRYFFQGKRRAALDGIGFHELPGQLSR